MFIIRLLSSSGELWEKLIVLTAFFSVVFFSVILHEYSHAYVAYKSGDNTPKYANRLTFNPKAHFDLTGFLLFVFVGFGWAKPVPINPNNFSNYRRDVFKVSISGIVANVCLAILLSLMLFFLSKFLLLFYSQNLFTMYLSYFLLNCLIIGIKINLMLALFNALPIYPLDGYNVINALFKVNLKYQTFMVKYGWTIILSILGIGMLGRWLGLPWLDLFGTVDTLIQKLINWIIEMSISSF